MKTRSSHSYQIHPDNCFGCGRENNFGLKIDFTFSETEQKILFPITFDMRHSNTPTTVHGGILSAILDEAMGSICSHLGHIVVTAEMCIKYNKMVSLHHPYMVESWYVREDKRFFYTQGHIMDPKTKKILTQGHGSFRKIPIRFFRRFFPHHHSQIKEIAAQVELNHKIIHLEKR